MQDQLPSGSVGRFHPGRCSSGDGLLEGPVWRTCVRPGRSSRLSWGNVVVNVDCYVQSIGCPVCLRPGTSGGRSAPVMISVSGLSECLLLLLLRSARLCHAESSAYVRHAVRVFDDKTSDGPTGKEWCVQRCARARKHLSCSCGRCRAASALCL